MYASNTVKKIKLPLQVLLICFILVITSTTGCLEDETEKEVDEDTTLPDGIFVTGANGTAVNVEPLAMDFVFSNVVSRVLSQVLELHLVDVSFSLHLRSQCVRGWGKHGKIQET